MSRANSPTLRGTRLGTVLRLWNPIMKRPLAPRLHLPWSRYFLLLSWTGRKTGARYTTPVSYVRGAGGLYLTTGDRWWRNVAGGGPVELRLLGRRRAAWATPITDRDASVSLHEQLFRDHPWFRLLAGIPAEATGGPDHAEVARSVDAGRVLVRVSPGRSGVHARNESEHAG
ncbi:MAG: hypothetical protein ACR2JZ_05730 [Candidatus Limnocylindrales bacterium]